MFRIFKTFFFTFVLNSKKKKKIKTKIWKTINSMNLVVWYTCSGLLGKINSRLRGMNMPKQIKSRHYCCSTWLSYLFSCWHCWLVCFSKADRCWATVAVALCNGWPVVAERFPRRYSLSCRICSSWPIKKLISFTWEKKL